MFNIIGHASRTAATAYCDISRAPMSGSDVRHVAVLLREVVDLIHPGPGKILVDATIGEGGHAEVLLKEMEGEGCLIGLDRDRQALEVAERRLGEPGPSLILVHTDFALLEEVLESLEVEGLDGVLLDLGVSSLQLEQTERGFAYRLAARLDMRMDTRQELDAWKVVNCYEERELARIISGYGEERWASRIARSIAFERKRAPIDTTDRLAEIVKEAIPAAARRSGGHPARRTFQAIRLEVNGELRSLEEVLPQTMRHLRSGGRMVVISYHSLEDRMVKRFLADNGSRCSCPMDEECACGKAEPLRILTPRPIRPEPKEVEYNPKSRSAKLRAAKKR
ncbi:MAG: 16S rRNA (cytosine(1402)-N(4))-methyltransferase RsmH [Actinomycetota bacterium]|nr:16S rRNA (cytosine(1402)-N(4))-methyltransferase RsmH [Actinomycetota bacterium]